MCRLAVALLASAAGACEPVATSPPEAAPVLAVGAAEAAAKCLASSHPILFHSMRWPAPLVSHLYVMREDGSDVREVARGGNLYSSTWSPDGRSIAYRRMRVSDQARDVEAELGLLSADDAAEVALFEDITPSFSNTVATFPPDGPSWSMDGRTLAFASRRGSGSWAVWLMSRSGGDARLLMPDVEVPHFAPSFAPDAPARLAYVAESEGGSEIWLIKLEPALERRLLTAAADRGRFMDPSFLRWSPDGTRLAFSAREAGGAPSAEGDREIYLLDVESGELTQLTEDEFEDVTPAWAPDGMSLLIGSDRARAGGGPARFELWRLGLDGRVGEALTAGTSSNAGADWYGGTGCGDSLVIARPATP